MADPVSRKSAAGGSVGPRHVADLLGGTRVLRRRPRTPPEAHELLLRGLPMGALSHPVDRLVVLRWTTSLEHAVGMSLRTFRSRRRAPSRRLAPGQGGRIRRFAEIPAAATAVLGSPEEAERWLERPAIGLGRNRLIDLPATPTGVGTVEDFPTRIEHCAYA